MTNHEANVIKLKNGIENIIQETEAEARIIFLEGNILDYNAGLITAEEFVKLTSLEGVTA